MFCAPTMTSDPLAALKAATRSTKGGQIMISRWLTPLTKGRNASKKLCVSAWVLYIFQLPAIKSLRTRFSFLLFFDQIVEYGKGVLAVHSAAKTDRGPAAQEAEDNVPHQPNGKRDRRRFVGEPIC